MQIPSLANNSIFQLSYVAQSTSRGGKLSMPVDSNMLLYSRFKHVYGTPSIGGKSGLPLSSLRAIDSLIDRLVTIRGRDVYFVNVNGMNREEAAFTVEKLQRELNSLVSGSELPLTAGTRENDTGIVMNFVA